MAGALEEIEARLAAARPGDTIRMLDCGTGTGLAAIELLKACRERGLEERLERERVGFELHLADLPSSWFAHGHELLRGGAWTRFHSLRDGDTGFRALLDVTGGRRMDVVLSSMVFHLIPTRALPALAADLASVLSPGGRLLWNSPDLGSPGPYALLFHDPNRALREHWLARLNGGADAAPQRRANGQARADRRVLPIPNRAESVAGALAEHLPGDFEVRTYEMLRGDFLDALLMPSNQEEYLSEIDDRDAREPVIRELLLDEILPRFERGSTGTALGLNVQWTLGSSRAPGDRGS